MLNPATLNHNYLHSELTFRSPKNAPFLKYRNTWCDISQNDAMSLGFMRSNAAMCGQSLSLRLPPLRVNKQEGPGRERALSCSVESHSLRPHGL